MIAILLSFLLLWGFGERCLRLRAVEAEIRQTETALSRAAENETALRKEIRALGEESRVEEIARKELLLIRPGETVCLSGKVSEDILPSAEVSGVIED